MARRKDSIFEGNMSIELYNLDLDHKEQNNVALSYPEIVEKISCTPEAITSKFKNGVIFFKYVTPK